MAEQGGSGGSGKLGKLPTRCSTVSKRIPARTLSPSRMFASPFSMSTSNPSLPYYSSLLFLGF